MLRDVRLLSEIKPLVLCWRTVGTLLVHYWLAQVRAYAGEGKGSEKGRDDTDDDDERQDTQPEARPPNARATKEERFSNESHISETNSHIFESIKQCP